MKFEVFQEFDIFSNKLLNKEKPKTEIISSKSVLISFGYRTTLSAIHLVING